MLLINPVFLDAYSKPIAGLLQQINYWIGKKGIITDNKKWTVNTVEQWAQQLRVSKRSIIRYLNKLKADGIIEVKKLFKHRGDNRNWYAINYERLKELFPAGLGKYWKNFCDKVSLVGDKLSPTYIYNNEIKINNTSLEEKKNFEEEERVKMDTSCEKDKIIAEMTQIAFQALPKLQADNISLKAKESLWEAYNGVLNKNTATWGRVCINASRSKFLMGEKPGKDGLVFNLNLVYLAKKETIEKMLTGKYGADRPVFVKHLVEKLVAPKPNYTFKQREEGYHASQSVREDLIKECGYNSFKTWVCPLKTYKVGNEIILVYANRWKADQAKHEYGHHIENVYKAKCGADTVIIYKNVS